MPLSTIDRPTTAGSAPNRWRHSACESTTTRLRPTWSSPASKVRPCSARTPNTSKYAGVTPAAGNALGVAFAGQVKGRLAVGGDGRKRLVQPRPVEKVRRRHAVVEHLLGGAFLPHHHQRIGLRVRQGLQQHRVHGGEHRGIRADGQRQREDDDGGRAGLPEHQPERVPQVVSQGIHPPSPGFVLDVRECCSEAGPRVEPGPHAVPARIGHQAGPEPPPARTARRGQLLEKQPLHLDAVLRLQVGRKQPQQPAIETVFVRHQRAFSSLRVRGSTTSALRRRASARATLVPSDVRLKY